MSNRRNAKRAAAAQIITDAVQAKRMAAAERTLAKYAKYDI